jgi:membrane protease YdiL (CAAX protease family)
MFCNFIKNHIQILVIICLVGLDYLSGIFTKFQFNILWFGVTYDLLGYLLLLIILIEQKKNLGLNNVDSFSLILLVLFHTSAYYSNYSSGLKNIMALVNLLIAIIFSVIFIKNKNKDISQFSIKQIFVLLIGLIVGLCIAIFKIQLNNSDLLILASKNPIPFINSIIVSLSVFAIREEFIYRGVIWGYLRRKGVNDWWIIVTSSLVWVFAHSNIYGNTPELINFIGLGIIFGILVKVTKSINISIGVHAGYSSFLVLQDLIIK